MIPKKQLIKLDFLKYKDVLFTILQCMRPFSDVNVTKMSHLSQATCLT